ncbi:MAG: NAD-dependent epimerase/dehydratase family protein [Chloroflexota bacterium]
MAKTAFVTGASGFTGSHLCRRLVERGDQVRALVRPNSKTAALSGLDLQLVHGDLANGSLPTRALRGVDVVYHVAAAYRTERVPARYFFDVNANGTSLLLKAAMDADVGRFVHFSTVGVLGDIKAPPANEAAPHNPHDTYQESKLEGELRVLSAFKEQALDGVVVRPTGIYGPGDTRFLKLFRAIDRGIFWMIGRGNPLFHLIYIDDLIDGVILAGEREEALREVFILGGEEYVTIRQLVEMIAEVLGRTVPDRHVPLWPVMLIAKVCQRLCRPLGIEPPIYPRRLDFFTVSRAFEIAKAKRLLGFQPKVDLKTGLTRTADWYRQNKLL